MSIATEINELDTEWIDFLSHLDPQVRFDTRLTVLLRTAFAGGALAASVMHLHAEQGQAQIAVARKINRFGATTGLINKEFAKTGVPIATA